MKTTSTQIAPDTLRAARAVLITALVTITLACVMGAVGGAAPPATRRGGLDFSTAVVGFELARSPADVFAQLGPIDAGAERRQGIELTTKIDFAFMLAYPALAFALVLYVGHLVRAPRGVMLLALVLALETSVADAVENLTLFDLLRCLHQGEITPFMLSTLDGWTSVKWASIFVNALLFGTLLMTYARRARSAVFVVLAVLALAAGVTGLVGLFVRDTATDLRPLVEQAMNVVVIAWLAVTLHAARMVRQLGGRALGA